MAASAAARSMFRAASSRGVAAASTSRFASQAKPVPPMFRAATARRSSLLSPLRNPVEMSFCVESMLPYHTATASALMTSKLSISGHSFAWLSDACKEDF